MSMSTRYYGALVLAAITACIVFWASYQGLIDLENKYQLQARGQITKGTINSHIELDTRKNCGRAALIKYSVGQREYTTKVFGCGISPEVTPIGKAVEVRYLVNSPEVSIVRLYDTNDGKSGIPLLLGAWGFMALVLFEVWSAYRKKKQL
jgi:hypothetical protein